MNKIDQFKVGETYTNDQIRFSLDLENLGGIRPSLDSNGTVRHVAIMTAAEDSGRLSAENPYHDRIEGNILIYTAQGREGDQALQVVTSGLLSSTLSRRRFLDSLTSVARHTDSLACSNCCATIRRIRPTRRGFFEKYGYLSFVSMTGPRSFQ
jgi:hypothetical protein